MTTNKFLVGCLCILLVSCGPSTQITKTWTDPSLTPSTATQIHKVLCIGLMNNETNRRIAEDKMVGAFKRATGVQSYSYLTAADTVKEQVEERLKKDGFDGVIIMHLTGVDKSLNYNPGTGYYGWYGYRGNPGYYSEDKTFYVETNYYSLANNKMLWSGTTSSLNPTKMESTMDDIITALKGQLQQQGLYKPK